MSKVAWKGDRLEKTNNLLKILFSWYWWESETGFHI